MAKQSTKTGRKRGRPPKKTKEQQQEPEPEPESIMHEEEDSQQLEKEQQEQEEQQQEEEEVSEAVEEGPSSAGDLMDVVVDEGVVDDIAECSEVIEVTNNNNNKNNLNHENTEELVGDSLEYFKQQQQQEESEEHEHDLEDRFDSMTKAHNVDAPENSSTESDSLDLDLKDDHQNQNQNQNQEQQKKDEKPESETNEEEDFKKRQLAFEQFQKLEKVYRTLHTKILDEKERDLERIEQSIRDGDHPQLQRDLDSLRDSREHQIKVANSRLHQSLTSIHNEYEESVRQHFAAYQQQKLQLRRFLVKKCARDIRQVQFDAHSDRKWPPAGYRPTTLADQLHKVRTVPYPVLEQFHWRLRERGVALTAYHASRCDDFGCQVPPRQQPMALFPQEAQLDVEMIRRGTAISDPISTIKRDNSDGKPVVSVSEKVAETSLLSPQMDADNVVVDDKLEADAKQKEESADEHAENKDENILEMEVQHAELDLNSNQTKFTITTI